MKLLEVEGVGGSRAPVPHAGDATDTDVAAAAGKDNSARKAATAGHAISRRAVGEGTSR